MQTDDDGGASGTPLGRFVLYLVAVTASTIGAALAAKGLGGEPQVQAFAAVAVFGVLLLGIVGLDRGLARGEPIGLVGSVLAIALALIPALSSVGIIEQEPALGCINTDGDLEATISSNTTVVYSRATPASDPRRLLLRGCDIKPSAWCVGAVHADAIEDIPDSRWYVLPDGEGLVPSGRTVSRRPKGSPTETQSICPGAKKPPSEVSFSAATLDRERATVSLQAQSKRAAVIGFAVRTVNEQWTRLGWDRTPEDGEPLLAPMIPGMSPGNEIVAVACLAFQHPSRATARATLGAGTGPATDLDLIEQPVAKTAPGAACDAAVPTPTD